MFAPVSLNSRGEQIRGKRPNMFAYIEDINMLMDESFGHDSIKDSYFYFNRRRAVGGNTSHSNSMDFPAVLLYQGTLQIDRYFMAPNQDAVDDYKIMIVDTLDKTVSGTNAGDSRYFVDILDDSKRIVSSIFEYLANAMRFNVVVGGDTVQKWTTQGYIDFLTNEGLIDSHTIDRVSTAEYLSVMKVRNNESLGRPVRLESKVFYGVMFEIKMPWSMCEVGERAYRVYDKNIFGAC